MHKAEEADVHEAVNTSIRRAVVGQRTEAPGGLCLEAAAPGSGGEGGLDRAPATRRVVESLYASH